MQFKVKEVAGWKSNDGKVLCWECFSANNEDFDSYWLPILEQDTEDTIFICDGKDCHCII